jgi:DNA-binding winged helix-turn-helix (wHTH) protein
VVLTRDALLEGVWGTDYAGETRTIDVHVAELRKKLGPASPPIETIRGVGYRLVPPPREPVASPGTTYGRGPGSGPGSGHRSGPGDEA